ncbi:ankyrin repeat domain-containing protein [Ottowia sp. GY511]|nr:ankyrin repeat domain-containing protein [Ottowia sp. GY511]
MPLSTHPLVRAATSQYRRQLLAWLAVLALPACGQQGADMAEAPQRSELFGSPQAAALYSAASKGDLPRARRLMAEGANPNAFNAREQNLLDVAMVQGDRRAFDGLLELGADPAFLGGARDTSMHFAAQFEDPYWLKAMLTKGASPDARNAMEETPLFAALGPTTDKNVQLLLDAGADVHARSRSRQTLLHKAANINAFGDVARFLELGVDPTAKNDVGNTFQASFFRTPERALNSGAKDARAKVRAWLRAHNIPIEESGQR